MYRDVEIMVWKCEECQFYAPVRRISQAKLMSIQSPWPFYQWGIDIVGPFLEALEQFKFLVVTVDYFTKWAETEPLVSITGTNILKSF